MARSFSSSRIIYANRGDGIAAILQNLQRIRGSSVVLVANNCPALHSDENLRLLQAQAAEQGLDLTLVCGDRAVRRLAGDLGIRVVASLGALHAPDQAERGAGAETTKTGIEDEALRGAERTIHATPAARDTRSRPGEKKGRASRAIERSFSRILAWATLIVVLLFAVWGVLYLALPSARIELTPVQQRYSTELQLLADPQVSRFNAATGQMPARLIVLEETDEMTVDATGEQDVPVGRAKGSVVFRNRISQPVDVAKGTVVLTDDNRRFETVEDETIPPTSATSDNFGVRRVDIVAIEPGPDGNVEPRAITHIEDQSLNQRLEVNHDTPTLGGGLRVAAFVTEQDRLQLYDQLRQTLVQRLEQQLRESHNPIEYIFVQWDDDVVVEQAEYDKAIGEEGERVMLRMKVKFRVTAFSRKDMAEVAPVILETIVEKQLDSYTLLEETVELGEPSDYRIIDGVVQFKLSAQAELVSTWDLGKVRRELTNATREEAETYLNALMGVGDFTLEMGPDWYERMPRLWFRIAIDVQPPLRVTAENL